MFPSHEVAKEPALVKSAVSGSRVPPTGADDERARCAFIQLRHCAVRVAARLSGFGSGPARAGLTQSQFDVLETVFQMGAVQPQDLVRKQWFSKGNLTVVLQHLEKAGWVVRRRLDGDRRFIEVRLTEAGRTLMRGLLPRHTRAVSGLFAALSAGEQGELIRLCRKLSARAARQCGGTQQEQPELAADGPG